MTRLHKTALPLIRFKRRRQSKSIQLHRNEAVPDEQGLIVSDLDGVKFVAQISRYHPSFVIFRGDFGYWLFFANSWISSILMEPCEQEPSEQEVEIESTEPLKARKYNFLSAFAANSCSTKSLESMLHANEDDDTSCLNRHSHCSSTYHAVVVPQASAQP